MPGKNVYIHDVATIQDTTDINYGCALVNGRKSVYLPVVKKDTASTLTVVRQVNEALPMFRSVVPEDVQVRYEFDESPTVRAAIKSVATEGAIGATLVGLMILHFSPRRPHRGRGAAQHPLGPDAARWWGCGSPATRSTSCRWAGWPWPSAFWSTRPTVDGGEHPQTDGKHRQHGAGGAAGQSDHGRAAAAGHVLRALGVHSHLHHGGARPVALHAADAGRGLLHDHLVPALQHAGPRARGLADCGTAGSRRRTRSRCSTASCRPSDGSSSGSRELRWITVPAYLAGCGLILWFVGRQVGTELFPQVDAGQFVLRFRAPPGSQYELTRRTAVKILDVIDKETQGKVAISMGYVGLAATNTATNNMLLFMRGPDDGELRVRLNEGSGIRLADLRERLRKASAGSRSFPGCRKSCRRAGCAPEQAAGRAKLFAMGFEPGDIVSEVMSLGSPMPIEVVVAGPNREDVRAHALKVLAEMKKIPTLRDVQLYQQLDYPAVRVDIDRQRAGLSGVTVQDVTNCAVGGHLVQPLRRQELLAATRKAASITRCRSRFPARAWTARSRSKPCHSKVNPDTNLMIRDVAKVQTGTVPGEVDRMSMQRYLSVIANVEGEDLGRAVAPDRAGHRRCRQAAPRRARDGPRAGRPHARDVRRRWPWAWPWPWS